MATKNVSLFGKSNALLGLQFLSDFGDQITYALLALCVLDITKSTGQVGVVYVLEILGFLLFTFVGGYLGDRLSKRNILFFSDMARALVVLIMMIAISEKSLPLIYLSSFLLSVLGSLHGPVKMCTWAQSIPNGYLVKYNSLYELSIHSSRVIGPLIAAAFVSYQIMNLGFMIDAATFFICALGFLQIVAPASKSPESFRRQKRDYLSGFKIIATRKELLKYISYDAIQMISFGAFNATFLVLAQRDFGWTKGQYSYHLAIAASLTAIGAAMNLLPRIQEIKPTTKLIFCAIVSAIAFVAALQIKIFPMASIFMGICDGLTIFTTPITRSMAQSIGNKWHQSHLSSIMASRTIIIKSATLLGVTACLFIDDFLSLERTLTIFVIPMAFSCLPFMISRPGQRSAHTSLASDSK